MDPKSQIRRLAENYSLMGLNELLGAMRFYYPVSIIVFSFITESYATAMGVFSFAMITTAALEIPTGVLSDKWGRRTLLILGCILEFLGATGYVVIVLGWIPPQTAHATIALYLSSFLFGAANALFSGNNYALLYETAQATKQTHRLPHILGTNSSMEQIGLAISGVVAGIVLWWTHSFLILFSLSLVPMALNIVISCLVTEPPKHSVTEGNAWQHMKEAVTLLVKNKELRVLALCSGWKTGLGMSSHLFMPQFINTVWPLWAVPFYRTGQNIFGAISYRIAGHVIDIFGHYKTLFAGSLLSGILSVIAYALSSFFSPFLLFITQMFWAAGNTADQSLQQKHFSSAQRSTMGSIISLTGSMFNSGLAILLGLAADRFGESNALILAEIAAFPVILGYHHLYRNDKKKPA